MKLDGVAAASFVPWVKPHPVQHFNFTRTGFFSMDKKDQFPTTPMPRPTAQVETYVEVMGAELAVKFLLEFGGAELSVSDSPNGRSAYEALIGPIAAAQLAEQKHRLQKRVPLAKEWLAKVLQWQGHSKAQIARTLRVSDTSVRKWLNK